MIPTRARFLLAVLVAVIALAAMTATAYAAPIIPIGLGWNAHHSSYPGYCLDCHDGFAKSPPNITAGSTPPHGDRGSTCTQCHTVVTPLPKPKVLRAYFGNIIAYDMASLRTAPFRASTDTTGAAVELRVKTPSGVKLLYKGTMSKANGAVSLGIWNGMGADGKRMPTGLYDWTLKMSTSGGTTTVTGKVRITRTYYMFTGESAAELKSFSSKLNAGPVNVYVSASTTATTDSIRVRAFRGTTYAPVVGTWSITSATPLATSVYMSGKRGIPSAGTIGFDVLGGTRVTFKVTTIQ
jgi:hypothetical protein